MNPYGVNPSEGLERIANRDAVEMLSTGVTLYLQARMRGIPIILQGRCQKFVTSTRTPRSSSSSALYYLTWALPARDVKVA